MSKKFQRKIGAFKCLNCGAQIEGSGYTNHCPKCLWSRHVDINPGDRQESCQGMMEPIGIELKSAEKRLIHRCGLCGIVRKNKLAESDNFEETLKITRKSGISVN